MESFFDALLNGYKRSLRGVLKHHYIMAAVFFLVIGATIFLFGKVSKGFIPDADNDSMNITVEAQQGTSYYKMVEYMGRVTEIVRKDPNIESFLTSVGGGFGSTSNQARVWVQLKPRRERALGLQEVINELRPKLSRLSRIPRVHDGASQYTGGRTHDQERLRFYGAGSGYERTLQGGGQAGA